MPNRYAPTSEPHIITKKERSKVPSKFPSHPNTAKFRRDHGTAMYRIAVYRFENLSNLLLSLTYNELIIKMNTGMNARITSLPGTPNPLYRYTRTKSVAPARIERI